VRLLGQAWPNVYNASGARGFFGEGYAFHKPWRKLGLDYAGSGFVAKTTTLEARAGNMPLNAHYGPKALFPDCIVVKPYWGVVLNAVGLSGPGADVLITEWTRKPQLEPWIVSFMSVGKTLRERLDETTVFFEKLRWVSPIPRFAVQVNLSCPNTHVDRSDERELIEEAQKTLDVAERIRRLLKVPVLLKLAPTVSPAAGFIIAKHDTCDALVMGNTVPWGKLPDDIPWKEIFGSTESPLKRYGGGGLSGMPLLPLTCKWLLKAKALGIEKPIIAGGGVLKPEHAVLLIDAGATAIEIGSVSILRPWRVQKIIQRVNQKMAGGP
jgi:dihydroorotate dehydrogenase (NAD+) catalytic subunit